MQILGAPHHFFPYSDGIIMNNSYNLYYRRLFRQHCLEHNVNYIHSVDVDLSYLHDFPFIEYLTIPPEAENIEEISCLPQLKGLEIPGPRLTEIPHSIIEKIEMLSILEDPVSPLDLSKFPNLRALSISNSSYANLHFLKSDILQNLRIVYCLKLKELYHQKNLPNIEKLELDYCRSLNSLECLNACCKISYLKITDCPNIDAPAQIPNLSKLEFLSIIGSGKRRNSSFASLDFIANLPLLKTFYTDLRIKNGDLRALLSLEDVYLSKVYSNYNLSNEDLPHK